MSLFPKKKNEHIIPCNKKNTFVYFLFCFFIVIFYIPEIFWGRVFLFSDRISTFAGYFDVYSSFSPWSAYQWTPRMLLGFSFARAAGIFFHFPENLLLRIFPVFTGLLLSEVLYFLIAQIFTYKFLRLFGASVSASVLGAVMFVFSGTITRRLVHYELCAIILATPLLFFLFELLARHLRLRLILTLSLLIGNSLFFSHMQLLMYQLIICFVYYSIRSFQLHGIRNLAFKIVVFIIICVIGLSIASSFLLPFYDQINNSVTSEGRGGSSFILDDAYRHSRLFKLFVLFNAFFSPKAVGSDMPYPQQPSLVPHSWEWSVYIGILPWFFLSGIWVLRRRKELLPFIVILLLSLVIFIPNLFRPFLPDTRFIFAHLPIFNKFHIYERLVFPGVFSLSCLLAFSFDELLLQKNKYGLFIPLIISAGLLTISSFSTIFTYTPNVLPLKVKLLLEELVFYSGGSYIRFTRLGSIMSIIAVFAVLLLVIYKFFRFSRRFFVFCSIVLLIFDLFCHAFQSKTTLVLKEFLSLPNIIRSIPRESRYITVTKNQSWIWDRNVHTFEARQCLWPVLNIFFFQNDVSGYTLPLLSNEEYEIFSLMLAEVPCQRFWVRRDVSSPGVIIQRIPLWRRYCIQYLITDFELADSGLSLVDFDGRYRIYKILDTFPDFYCSSIVFFTNAWDKIQSFLIQEEKPDMARSIVLSPDDFSVKFLSSGKIISHSQDKSTEIYIDVDAGENGTFLVFNERWTKEWQATCDGQPIKVYRTNGILQGVFVPLGRHTICFRYRDKHLLWGCKISLFALIIILIGYFFSLSKPAKASRL